MDSSEKKESEIEIILTCLKNNPELRPKKKKVKKLQITMKITRTKLKINSYKQKIRILILPTPKRFLIGLLA